MKRKKRIVSVIMAVTLIASVFAFTGCGSSNGSSSDKKAISGTWKCTALDLGSGNILDQLGSTYADSIKFTALDNGDAQLDMGGNQIPMSWKWMDDNKDYKLSISLADYAKSYGMTEEELKKQMTGSAGGEVPEKQEYAATIKDGKLKVDMAVFYKNAHRDSDSDSSSQTQKMEFTFERTGDAPDSLSANNKLNTSSDANTSTSSSAE